MAMAMAMVTSGEQTLATRLDSILLDSTRFLCVLLLGIDRERMTCYLVLDFLSSVLSCPIVSYRVLSCPIVSYRVLSCPIVSCRVVSCPFRFYVEEKKRRYTIDTIVFAFSVFSPLPPLLTIIPPPSHTINR
jgi:hypothetical protein